MLSWLRSPRILIPLAVVIIASGAGVAWRLRPTAVVNRSLQNVGALTSADFTTTLELANNQATEQALGERSTLEINVDGVYQRRDDASDTLSADVTFTTKTESVSVQVEGEIRLIEDQAYILITRAPAALPIVPEPKGKWFALPRRGSATDTPTQNEPAVLVANVTRVGRESIGETMTTKYTADATPAAVINFMDVIADILGTSLTDDQIAEIRQGISANSSVPLELWIANGSHLKQLGATLTLANSNTTRLTVRINERNVDVNVSAPPDAQPLSDALTPPAAAPAQ